MPSPFTSVPGKRRGDQRPARRDFPIATLILATASVALTSKVNAGPTTNHNPTQPEANYFDRASKVWDGGAQ